MDDKPERTGTKIYRGAGHQAYTLPWERLEELPKELEKVVREDFLPGRTVMKDCGCGHMYITGNRRWEDGRLVEVFIVLGKTGGCKAAQLEAIGRLVSRELRYGIPTDEVRKDLRGIMCGKKHGFGPNKVLSCADAVGQFLEEEMAWETTDYFKEWFEIQKKIYVKRRTMELEEQKARQNSTDAGGTGAG